MAAPDADGAVKILSAKLGVTPTLAKATRAIHVRKAAPLPKPGSHAALLRRLFGGK